MVRGHRAGMPADLEDLFHDQSNAQPIFRGSFAAPTE